LEFNLLTIDIKFKIMEDIIKDKFIEWTKDKSPEQARVSIYTHVRDIPYAIIPEFRDPVLGPQGLLKTNQGSCIPKHFLLGLFFEKLKIPVKYATYLFKWDDPSIKYPLFLRKIVKSLPIGTHLACKAFIEGRWVLVDATWDSPLKKFGFPVNENWDGKSNTKNAVKPIKEIIHETLEERIEYTIGHKKSWTEEEARAFEEFPPVFNAWISSLRK